MTGKSVLAEAIRLQIKTSGLKQYVVADRAAIDRKKFSDMLNGRRIIKGEDVRPITDALGITPNELFGIKNNKSA